MKKILSVVLVLTMVLGITAFECSSKEMTSAKMYLQQKKYDKAKEALEQELTKNPKNDEAYWMLGSLYGDENKMEPMIENFNKSLEISKKFEKDINDYKLYFWSTNFNRGVGFYNKSQKVSPDSAKGFLEKAEESFTNAVKVLPDSTATYLNLAYAQFTLEKKDAAISTLEAFVAKKADVDAYLLLGQLLTEKEKYAEVEKHMSAAREKFPENSQILELYSNSLVMTNKMDVALETFRAGVEKDPSNKIYRYNYGTILMNAKKFDEAIAQLSKAVELDANYTNAQYNLAVCYVQYGSKLREEAEEKQTGSTAWKDYFNKSLPMFEKYLEANPNEVSIWEFLGKVYANLGMTEKSTEAFKKADSLRK